MDVVDGEVNSENEFNGSYWRVHNAGNINDYLFTVISEYDQNITTYYYLDNGIYKPINISSSSNFTSEQTNHNTLYKRDGIHILQWEASNGYLTADKVFNAVFNDYAEYRSTIDLTPGHVVIDNDDGSLSCTTQRL